jgi:uncharacterized protein
LAFRKALVRDTLALSDAVEEEVLDVLHRPRLARFLNNGLRAEVLGVLLTQAARFDPAERVQDCRDAKDNKYLELALVAGAGTIVASDEDLLVLHPWRGVRILRPADYLAFP